MNEGKASLRSNQQYKLFQQQQVPFIAALEHCRENAHKIRPISSIVQMLSHMEHHCNTPQTRPFCSCSWTPTCTELSELCQHFEALHSGTLVTNNFKKRKTVVNQSNILSRLRAKYPHNVVNHLSCYEAGNHYGSRKP